MASQSASHPGQYALLSLLLVYLVIVVFLSAYTLGLNNAQIPNLASAPSSVGIKPQPSVIYSTANWQTYSNNQYGFSIQYPFDTRNVIEMNTDQPYTDTKTHAVVSIDTTVTQDIRSNTGVRIFEDSASDWLQRCLTTYPNSPSQTRQLTQMKRINHAYFYIFGEQIPDDAMGGVRGLLNEYRIIHNNSCVRIQTVVSWRSIEFMYQATGSAIPTNEQLSEEQNWIQFQEQLNNQVLSTFTFTDQNLNVTPTISCIPRPACLSAIPRCLIAEPANGWCP